MFRIIVISGLILASLAPGAAHGQSSDAAGQPPVASDIPSPASPPDLTISGSATIASDYRLRGISQTDQQMAVQGGLTVTHKSGLYIGAWASNLAAWGTFGGANMELDLIGGFKTTLVGKTALDVGVTYYVYPGGASRTSYIEPYAKLSGAAGPLSLTANIAYAPRQKAIGKWYDDGASAAAGIYDHPGAKADNTYVWSDAALAVPHTPFTAKAHLGHSWGMDGLGPNATAPTPTGSYTDWSLGVDTTWRNLTLNVSWIDTDISNRDAAYLRPSFSKGQDGTGNIAGSTVFASLTAAF
jgi:hypothetical protein